MSTENLDAFLSEVQTIDIRFENVEGRTPAMTLNHYDQNTASYDSVISTQRELALSIILLQRPEQIQFNVNRLQLINERFSQFWIWYGEQLKSNREGGFSTDEFLYKLSGYLRFNYSKYDMMLSWMQDHQSFLFDLHDAVMYKQGGIKYILYQLKSITGIEPKLFGDSEERVKEEDKLNSIKQNLSCSLSEQQIDILYKHLMEKSYIATVALISFSEALLATEPINNPIHWLKSNRGIAYLFRQMHTKGLINNDKWQSIIEKRGLFINKSGKFLKAQDFATAINDYQKDGNPKEADDIDVILNEMCAL